MAFTQGLHVWEINATISCASICKFNSLTYILEFGVYCPLSNVKDYMITFQSKSPRTILICLDLYELTLKFWLNGKRQKKILELPVQGPYIPCVKIGTERNTLTLNPFVKLPPGSYEDQVDRTTHLERFLMPHLQNSLCITELP